MRFDDRVVNGLGVLAAVVKSGNFAVAGKSLNMSQSGVSRAIARLEARLGARLLERTTRTVTLSEEGRRLYEQIVPLLAGLEEAAASVTTSKDGRSGNAAGQYGPVHRAAYPRTTTESISKAVSRVKARIDCTGPARRFSCRGVRSCHPFR